MWRCTLWCNSDIAAKGVLPTCQDTGTAIIVGKKRAACMDRWW
ncbi:fumarate hydratase [Escherichia coli]